MSLTEKEGRNVLFNNALSLMYGWLYNVRHMVEYHSESKRENNVWLVIQCQTYGRVPLRKQERK